jgi:hypothetical protein
MASEGFKLKLSPMGGYDAKCDTWRCIVCGVDMGPQNPRQLCNKTYCPEQLEQYEKSIEQNEKKLKN